MMTNSPSSEYNWQPLSHEERRRHEILFYSQGPVDGFLPGEHARELFLRSKLPLHILSQIWNLVDQPQDNVLDVAEFTAAVHLVQQTMRGVPLPKDTVPPCLIPQGKRSEVRIPTMNRRELCAYRKLFQILDKNGSEHLQGDRVREVLQTSGLPPTTLAQIWDLSDLDRDGKLSIDEFCIACHLTRYAKKGRIHFTGPVNIYSSLPHRMLKTDLAAKKAKMAELEDLKKRLMAIRAKKKAEAGRESERAKIWRERLEILQKRHQALREDGVGVNEVILSMDKKKLDKVTDIVQQIESSSERLDKKQQQVRKETATVIMEAEKLSQEVKHLQNEVDKLRENRRRTSQLKDLDPFHQLFEEQKERTESGVSAPKKKYDIHIPFKTDPFNPRKLDSHPLSGEELFNCSISDSNSEIEEIFGENQEKRISSSTDPWMVEVNNSELQQLTFGFEDSFVDTWGRSDNNQNVITEQLSDGSPFSSVDFKFTPDDEEPVFRTVCVTEQEDDLWSSLPDAVLATQHETMKYLQARWAATSERLVELERDLNKTHQSSSPETSEYEGDTTDVPAAVIDNVSVTSNNNLLTVGSLSQDHVASLYNNQRCHDVGNRSEQNLDKSVIDNNNHIVSHLDAGATEESALARQLCDSERVCDDGSSVGDKARPVQIIISESPGDGGVVIKRSAGDDLGNSPSQEFGNSCCERISGQVTSQSAGNTSDDLLSSENKVGPSSSQQSAPQVVTQHSKSVSWSSESSRDSTPLHSQTTSPKPPPRSKSLKKRRLSSKRAPIVSESHDISKTVVSTDSVVAPGVFVNSAGSGQQAIRHERLGASLSDACVQRHVTPPSLPPKPPPRLKKLKRLSQISQLSEASDILRSSEEKQSLTRTTSTPAGGSVYENIDFTLNTQKYKGDESPKVAEHVEDKDTVNISQEVSKVLNTRDPSLDVVIPNDTDRDAAKPLNTQNSENFYVNVADSSNKLEIGSETDDDMDAKSRKEELEKLRSQFFGKKSRLDDDTSNGSSPGVVSAMSDIINPQPVLNSGTVFIQLGSTNQQTPQDQTESLYSLVKKTKDSPVRTSNGKTSSDDAGLLLDLDGNQQQCDLSPVLPSVTCDLTRSVENPNTSKTLVDLDQFSGQSELDNFVTGVNVDNDAMKKTSSSAGVSAQKNTILLDLDEIQIIPESESKNSQRGDEVLIDTTIPTSRDVSSTAVPVSPPAAWEQAEQSDMSEGEDSFMATFVPGAEVAPEWPVTGTLHDEEDNEDSGIVLMSYQQRGACADLLDLHDPNRPTGTDSHGPSATSSHDSFDLLSSLGDSSEADKFRAYAVDVTRPNYSSQIVAGNQSTEDGIKSSSASAEQNVMTRGDLDAIIASTGLSTTDLQRPASSTSSRAMEDTAGTRPNTGASMFSDSSKDFEDVLVQDDPGSSVITAPDTTSCSESVKPTADGATQACRQQLHLDLKKKKTQSDSSLDPERLDADMDPATGLKKSGALSPLEKAKIFVMETEPCYKVKKKDGAADPASPLSPEQVALSLELEHERQEILEAVRVKKKNLDKWMPEFVAPESGREKTESERRYEERKRHMTRGGEPLADPEDENLTPFEKALRQENIRSSFLVTSDADKTAAKDQVLDTRVHSDGTRTAKDEVKSALKQIRKKEENELESVNEIVSSGKEIPGAENGKESAIEREIRLSREREAELKREQETRLKEQQHASQSPSSSMPIRKVPEPMKIEHSGHVTKEAIDAPPALPVSPVPSGSVYHQLTEVDRDSVILNSESIVDIEIREQQEREKALLKAGYIKQQTVDKEAEQSEFERREKEHERVQAHESVIDREIRIQQERERELQLLRQIVTSGAKQGQDKAAPAPSQQPQQQQQQQKTQPQQQIAQDTSPTARERAMASSPEPKPQPAHSEVVSYESALSTKSHEGESLIARELREQKEREAELRQRYKEMGLGNLLHNEDPPDTPFNAPEPPQPNISKLPARAKATLKSNTARGMSRSVSEPVKIEANNQINVHSQNEHVPQSVSQDMISQQTIAEEPRTPKVHPLDEPDLSDTAYKFVPQNETPIEREMRLAREREEELRRARGYPKLVSDPGAVIEIKEITTPMPKPHTLFKKGDEGDGKLMQKFASSRLQSEIEKEKRREQDLKQQGKISTLSSERDSGHQKYVDVIPKENIGANKQPNWKVQNAAARAVSPSHSVDSVDSSSQQPGGEQNGTAAAHHQAEPTARAKPEPPVLRRFVSHTATDTEKYNGRPSPHLAESRIEKELREMKEREEELRNLRRSISAMQSGDGELTNNTSNGQLQEKTLDEPKHNQSSNTVKATRRKSALAEEWERKFGASN